MGMLDVTSEKDWLYNRMQEAKKEVEAWKPWQKEAMGVFLRSPNEVNKDSEEPTQIKD